MSSDNDVLESMIQEKGLDAPRLKPTAIDDKIAEAKYHVFEGTCLTVCCLVLKNGFTVVGESACASPENFDKEVGELRAFQKAKAKIWELEGYAFLDRKHKQSQEV